MISVNDQLRTVNLVAVTLPYWSSSTNGVSPSTVWSGDQWMLPRGNGGKSLLWVSGITRCDHWCGPHWEYSFTAPNWLRSSSDSISSTHSIARKFRLVIVKTSFPTLSFRYHDNNEGSEYLRRKPILTTRTRRLNTTWNMLGSGRGRELISRRPRRFQNNPAFNFSTNGWSSEIVDIGCDAQKERA